MDFNMLKQSSSKEQKDHQAPSQAPSAGKKPQDVVVMQP